MNAAIDQQCELYIRENKLEDEISKKIEALYTGKGTPKLSWRTARRE